MPSILNLEDLVVTQPEQRDNLFSTAQLPQRRFPVRGLFYSLLVHGMLLAAAVSVPWNYWLPPASPLVEYAYTPISPKLDEPLLLPALAPAISVQSAPAKEGPGAAGAGGHSPAAMNRAFRGVVHKGPQVIVSDPPKPDNFVQTIRQDSLVHPPIFPIQLAVPNIVAVAPSAPVLRAQVQPPVEPPTKPVPVPAATLMSDSVEVVPPPPEVPTSTPKLGVLIAKAQAAQVAAPAPAAPETATPNSTKNLVIVSAVPIATTKEIKLPPGELHGAFAVSPTPLSTGGKNEKGVGGAGSAVDGSATLGRGNGPGTHGGTRGGNGEGSAAAGGGKAANGTGSGRTGTGNGPHGNGIDNGSGNGKGIEIASAGPSTPGGPFSNIRIDGGSAPANAKSTSATNHAPAGTFNYGITIVASASSGGGLKDYGVFHNEPVYTVFVDMADESSVSWTLQYSVLRPPGSTASQVQELITPPYPIEKSTPKFAPELSARFAGRLIVIQGVINAEGKVQNLKIIQSPHPYLGDALIAALQKDTFKAAESAGKAIAIKFLLGVPISATTN